MTTVNTLGQAGHEKYGTLSLDAETIEYLRSVISAGFATFFGENRSVKIANSANFAEEADYVEAVLNARASSMR